MTDNPPHSPAHPQPQAPSAAGRAWRGCLMLMFMAALMLSLCLNFALVRVSTQGRPINNPWDAFDESTYREGNFLSKILLIRIEGTIADGGVSILGVPQPSMVVRVVNSFERAIEDKDIKAVVLRINSPGGGVTASDEIYEAMQRFRKTNRPVIVSMGGVCASGGYYIAAPADKIYAQPTTITGSIGVMMQAMNMAELYKKVGVEDVTLTSGKNKAMLNQGKPVDPEHTRILQQTIDQMYGRFVGIVSEGRKISRKDIAAQNIADGRVFSADDALKLKLIDELGYLADAIKEARSRIKVDGAVIEYYQQRGFLGALNASVEQSLEAGTKPVEIHLGQSAKLDKGPQLLYLWKP